MVSNYAQQLTRIVIGGEKTGGAFVSRAVSRVGQLLCGVRGHDAMLHFKGRRMTMRCTSCGHETPGWDISDRAPRRRFDGDPRRHLLAKPRLVLRKSA